MFVYVYVQVLETEIPLLYDQAKSFLCGRDLTAYADKIQTKSSHRSLFNAKLGHSPMI